MYMHRVDCIQHMVLKLHAIPGNQTKVSPGGDASSGHFEKSMLIASVDELPTYSSIRVQPEALVSR